MRQAILSGELAPGERLPAERKLSELFGVTRVTVRSALARLAEARLLSVRQGSGYRVCDFRQAGGPDLIGGLLQATPGKQRHEVLRDLLSMRRAMARMVLERFVEMGDVDTQQMTDCIDEMERVAEGYDGSDVRARQALAEADLAVVAAIVDATHSAVVRLCMNPISQVVSAMPELCDAMYREPATNIAGYRALIDWCAAPDAATLDSMVGLLVLRDRATLSLLRTIT